MHKSNVSRWCLNDCKQHRYVWIYKESRAYVSSITKSSEKNIIGLDNTMLYLNLWRRPPSMGQEFQTQVVPTTTARSLPVQEGNRCACPCSCLPLLTVAHPSQHQKDSHRHILCWSARPITQAQKPAPAHQPSPQHPPSTKKHPRRNTPPLLSQWPKE